MGIEVIPFGDGKTVTGIVHISTVDAVFRTLDKKPISMEFHPYCGPNFYIDEDWWMPDEGTDEWDNLWKQFDGWWKAKGKEIYKPKIRLIFHNE